MKLGAFMRPVSLHQGAWRYPGAFPDANFNLRHLQQFIKTLERGKFDAFFMADHLALHNFPIAALKRSHMATSFEPFTLLGALSACTSRIGLVATASTTYEAPYHVARRFASLDHISGGRAGWNIVTTSNPDAALNFGMTEVEHGDRYLRAREFYDVVVGLWDSWADDAFIQDVEAGVYFDPDKLHVLNHRGSHFSVRGPLNIARPVQGWPVIFQAGASEPGRQLAAETADVIFGAEGSLKGAQKFYADIHRRMAAVGRAVDSLKIMPGALVIVGDTVAEAHAKRRHLDSLVDYELCIPALTRGLGVDASGFNPDAPLPPVPPTNESKTSREFLIAMAESEQLTVRQLAQRVGTYAGLYFVGTATSIADEMEQWLHERAADGFNIMFPFVPAGIDDFVNQVIPELQRRNLFRLDYEGYTLRENLGLQRPANKFFTASA
jgi:alkanesulfonate monooxygenase